MARQVFIIALVLLDLTILIVYTFVNPTDETETSFTADSTSESNQVRARRAPPPRADAGSDGVQARLRHAVCIIDGSPRPIVAGVRACVARI